MDWNNIMLMDPPTLPMMATIYGGPKVGKTELEASFPGLIVMAWEHPGPTLEGRKDIKLTPIIKSFEDGLGFLRFLYQNPGDFKTLGIDPNRLTDFRHAQYNRSISLLWQVSPSYDLFCTTGSDDAALALDNPNRKIYSVSIVEHVMPREGEGVRSQ